MPDVVLSKAQKTALEAMKDYIAYPHGNCFVLDGHAGTGKTTVLRSLAKWLNELPRHRIAYLAPTGKASHVMQSKFKVFTGPDDYMGTIHSFIYHRPKEKNNQLIFQPRETLECDLMVIDEASMISEQMYRQLVDFHVPIIFVGDSFQLPPVVVDKAVGVAQFSVMDNCDIHLTEVFRQGNGNPILDLATQLRFGEMPKACSHPDSATKGGVLLFSREDSNLYKKYSSKFAACYMKDNTVILTYSNFKKSQMNNYVRRVAGFSSSRLPISGERILCCNNDRGFGIVNGDMVRVVKTTRSAVTGCVNVQYADPLTGFMHTSIAIEAGFGFSKSRTELSKTIDSIRSNKDAKWQLERNGQFMPHDFDFGYAITVHKSQGSEWDNVFLLNDHPVDNEFYRWWYTAVTRAKRAFVWVL
ncbi:AAA family ATPase [uncultured Mailhella sp.]|uniref:ATP-dependent DNA helicase n=1 Tax=uncultured Mailhella sp. TaxID=1981031 RepID=UPI0025E8F09B|nr:AAA family ATPase [uncultured Mailhella sp.]